MICSTASAQLAGLSFLQKGNVFWVSNALESTISSFRLNSNRTISLLDQVAASGPPPSDHDPFGTTDGWIDFWISGDGTFLNQLFGLNGSIGVYKVNGSQLTFVQKVSGDLPDTNPQGIVAVDWKSKPNKRCEVILKKRGLITNQAKELLKFFKSKL